MSTVHQFPVQRNQPPAAPEEVADALGVAIDAAVGADASFEAREAAALALTNEATRLFLERELLAIADGHGTHVEVDGVTTSGTSRDRAVFHAVRGVDIERWTYREWACAMARRWSLWTSTRGYVAYCVQKLLSRKSGHGTRLLVEVDLLTKE